MTQYAIYFNQQWVGDHDEEWFLGRVEPSTAVVRDMEAAGVLVFAGGLVEDRAEAFSAGDKRFQEKCNRFFEESRSAGRTFVIATHNLEFVRTFCSQTLWLHKGRLMGFGPTAEVLESYIGFERR